MVNKKHPDYSRWKGMRSRCRNKNLREYKWYGGKGIEVCKRWESFKNFIEDMGPRPSEDHTLDRIDSNGNYEPANCRWATMKEQNNNRTDNKRLLFDGKIMTVSEISRITGISQSSLCRRKQMEGRDFFRPTETKFTNYRRR